MFLIYVDESGDPGLTNSPTRYFALTGLVIHELRWHQCLDQLVGFRRRLRLTYGLRLRDEIHAAAFINSPRELKRIQRYDRLAILRHTADELTALPDVNLINVMIDKTSKTNGYDVLEMAWRALVQRFENTMARANFPGSANPNERGLIICDDTSPRVQTVLRAMRRFNPIRNQPQHGPGSRNLPLTRIVEDPDFRDSRHSFFLQSVDVAAYLLLQKHHPNSYFKKRNAVGYFDRMTPILCRYASSTDPQGIVRI